MEEKDNIINTKRSKQINDIDMAQANKSWTSY